MFYAKLMAIAGCESCSRARISSSFGIEHSDGIRCPLCLTLVFPLYSSKIASVPAAFVETRPSGQLSFAAGLVRLPQLAFCVPVQRQRHGVNVCLVSLTLICLVPVQSHCGDALNGASTDCAFPEYNEQIVV